VWGHTQTCIQKGFLFGRHLIIFEQEILHFCFALGSINYVPVLPKGGEEPAYRAGEVASRRGGARFIQDTVWSWADSIPPRGSVSLTISEGGIEK
jgi:hypothetical protein